MVWGVGAKELTPALAAVLGAVAGSLGTGWAARSADAKRRKHERELARERAEEDAKRERTITRGTARVMDSAFLEAAAALKTTLDHGWWGDEESLSYSPGYEDKKLVAASVQDWASVASAKIALRGAVRARHVDAGRTPGANGPPTLGDQVEDRR